MDEQIERMVVSVRADTATFARPRRMRMPVLALVDQPDKIASAQEMRLDRQSALIRMGDRTGHRAAGEVDSPVGRREALDPALFDWRAWSGKPDRHQPSFKADRTARANCRDDWRSTCGSPGCGVVTEIATRTSRAPARPGSIRPLPDGTNSSGPRSPTI